MWLSLYVFSYSAACAVFLPTPSEAVLLLYPRLPLTIIIIISALGKGFGAYAVCRWWKTLDKAFDSLRVHWSIEWVVNFLKRGGLLDWVVRFVDKRGFMAYLFLQSTPLMPMRSSIYAYSIISRDCKRVAIGAAMGTILRNSAVFFIVRLGYLSMSTYTVN